MSKVNFLPEDYVEKKAQHRTNVICLVLFLLVMAGVAGGFLITEKRQKEIDSCADEMDRQMIQANQSLQQMEVLEGKKQSMMQKAWISASLMEPVPRSLLLATITNNLPPGVSLMDYSLDTKVIANMTSTNTDKNSRDKRKTKRKKKGEEPEEDKSPVVEKYETKIDLSGLAPTDMQVAKFISNLNKISLFRQVNLIFSEEHDEGEEILRKFKLMIMLDPNAKADAEDVELARNTHVEGM
jgi:Tfp pilus assembly protein PilN